MSYVDAFVLPIPRDRLADYKAFTAAVMHFWTENGCLQYVEAIEEDVARDEHNESTSFPRAVKAADDEWVAVGFAIWPDKATRDAANAKMREGEPPAAIPFDGKRLFWGGFTPMVEWKVGDAAPRWPG